MTAVVVLSWPPGEAATCRAATVVFFQSAASKQHVATLIEKGVAALDRNETEVAKGFFSSALQADPGNKLAHSYLGIIADRAGDLAEAERHFRSAATRSQIGRASCRERV